MKKDKLDFWAYLRNCITKNFLLNIAVTSYTQGKIRSEQLPYGVGKTSFAMWRCAMLNHQELWGTEHWKENLDWRRVQDNMYYDYTDIIKRLRKFDGKKINNAILDDAQLTLPATKSVPKDVYDFVALLSTSRPEISTFTLTCPNLLAIAAPLRRNVAIEIIVSKRGIFEAQRIVYFKNFKRPQEDYIHLQYLGEGKFSRLPKEVEAWYENWRIEEKKKWHTKHSKEIIIDTIPMESSQKEFLNNLVMTGNLSKKEVKNSFQKDDIEFLIQNKLATFINSGSYLAATKKGKNTILN